VSDGLCRAKDQIIVEENAELISSNLERKWPFFWLSTQIGMSPRLNIMRDIERPVGRIVGARYLHSKRHVEETTPVILSHRPQEVW
jgi:hypothetical protein